MNIREELKNAMLQRDAIAVRVLRYISTSVSNLETSSGRNGVPATDEEVYSIIRKLIAQTKETIDSIEKVRGRDAASASYAELLALESYLPPSLSEEEYHKIAKAAIEAVAAKSKADMKAAIAAAKEIGGPTVDPKQISKTIASYL